MQEETFNEQIPKVLFILYAHGQLSFSWLHCVKQYVCPK